jgi:hypothetical protein
MKVVPSNIYFFLPFIQAGRLEFFSTIVTRFQAFRFWLHEKEEEDDDKDDTFIKLTVEISVVHLTVCGCGPHNQDNKTRQWANR